MTAFLSYSAFEAMGSDVNVRVPCALHAQAALAEPGNHTVKRSRKVVKKKKKKAAAVAAGGSGVKAEHASQSRVGSPQLSPGYSHHHSSTVNTASKQPPGMQRPQSAQYVLSPVSAMYNESATGMSFSAGPAGTSTRSMMRPASAAPAAGRFITSAPAMGPSARAHATSLWRDVSPPKYTAAAMKKPELGTVPGNYQSPPWRFNCAQECEQGL
jgi:hypothetical protein